MTTQAALRFSLDSLIARQIAFVIENEIRASGPVSPHRLMQRCEEQVPRFEDLTAITSELLVEHALDHLITKRSVAITLDNCDGIYRAVFDVGTGEQVYENFPTA